jgi:hypothetical protein
MMHEPEKSDPSTVAAKPANNPEGLGAESVERREGAEGNTSKDRMRRTPSRVNMFSGLERVRERAKAEKKERFTALLHHVDVDLLRTAYYRLKRDAAPGVDGVTWGQYEQRAWKATLWICMPAFTAAPIGRSPHDASSFRRRMDESGRSGSRRWRTRSSSVRWWKCSTRFTRKIF